MAQAKRRAANRLGILPQQAELRIGYQRQPGRLRQHGFLTPQYAAVYVVAGHGVFVLDNQRHALGPGSLFQRLPGARHDVEGEDLAWYFLGVPAATVELMRVTGLPSLATPVLEPGLDPTLIARCEALIDRLDQAPPLQLMACQCALQQLIVDLHLRALQRGAAGREQDFAARACALLDASADGRRPLPAIARELGLGYLAFRKRFAAALGIAPGAWRIRRRIERAQALLADPALSIESVAERLGYRDVFAFSAQFKRHAGRSPSAFRRELG